MLVLDPSAAFAAGRTEVPIKQTVLTDGTIRYSIPVAVAGSRPVDVMASIAAGTQPYFLFSVLYDVEHKIADAAALPLRSPRQGVYARLRRAMGRPYEYKVLHA